jgi:hypothetical protein
VADEVEVVVLGAVEQLLQPFGMVGGGDVVEDGYGAEAPCVGVDQRVAVDAEEPAFAVDVQHVLRSADRLAVQGPQQGRLIGADRGAGRVGDRQAGGPLLGAAPHGPHVEAFARDRFTSTRLPSASQAATPVSRLSSRVSRNMRCWCSDSVARCSATNAAHACAPSSTAVSSSGRHCRGR